MSGPPGFASPRWRRRPSVPVLAAIGVVAAGVAAGSPTLVVAGPLAVAADVHRRHLAHRRRRAEALADAVPALVDELLQRLRGGASLAGSIHAALSADRVDGEGATALRRRLAPVSAGLAAGLGLAASLGRVDGAVGVGEVDGIGLTVQTLRVLVLRGGPAVPSLERLDDTLRSSRAVELEARAQAAQATASSAALAVLPALFAAGLAALDHRVARFYAFEPLGAACVVAAAALSYGGWWWMQHLVDRP
ncbi:MAG: hypothetical protein ACFCVK_01215 [Acidimicrobiales bacterium]